MPLSVPQETSPAGTSRLAGNTKETSPALHGASRAFNANAAASATSTGSNGAFTAASKASGGRSQTQSYNEGAQLSISRQDTGQSLRSRDVSPSHVAANFAASQASSRLSHSQSVRRPSPLQKMPTGSLVQGQQKGDLPLSPATKSLVQLYEAKQSSGPQKTQSVRYVSKPGPPIRSPKPVRPPVRPTSSSGVSSKEAKVPMTTSGRHNLFDGFDGTSALALTADSKTADPQGATDRSSEPPQAPPPRRKQHNTEEEPEKRLEQSPRRIKASIDVPTRGNPTFTQISKEPKAMSTVFSNQPTLSNAPPLNRSSNSSASPARSTSSFSKPAPQTLPRHFSNSSAPPLLTHMSVDSLATAMVASSLASSRNPSPTKSLPPPPPPRRHYHSHSLFHHSSRPAPPSRTPSPPKQPPKQMRQTMRKPLSPNSSSSDTPKRSKTHHLVRKHQHKHHEGDRKRYRTQITERERKRYEGVWAANKGILLPSSPTAMTTNPSPSSSEPLSRLLSRTASTSSTLTSHDPTTPTVYSSPPPHAVLNIVARDIYRRSRLPDDVLEEVWNLATSFTPGVDRLGREEFVVGMWLIDQRLRGNKLPSRVSESVWASVRRLPGIRIGGEGKR